MNADDRHSRAFLVRAWRERRERPDEPPVRRGSIDDVDGTLRVYFVSLPDMVDFMCVRAGMTNPRRREHCSARHRRPS